MKLHRNTNKIALKANTFIRFLRHQRRGNPLKLMFILKRLIISKHFLFRPFCQIYFYINKELRYIKVEILTI